MIREPLVSILVPCYNAAPWLAASLESALAQSWPRCEVILVDDGSTDGSLEVARKFEARGVRIFRQANAGASAARNRALREAGGDFIQFLDADDLISPGKIAAQVALLKQRPPGVLATCAWGRFTDDPGTAKFVDEAVGRDFRGLDFAVLCAGTGAMMHPSAWLAPRAVLDRAGPWNEALSLNDDGEYFCRAALAGTGLAFCPEPAARSYYRSGLSQSLSQRRSEAARRSQFRSLELIAEHLLGAEASPRTRQAVADLFQRYLHDFFPHPADLMRQAAARVAENGGSNLRPSLGPRAAALSLLIGWRNVRRIQNLFHP